MNREQLDEIRTRAEGLEGGAWYVGARECVDDIDLYRLPVLVEDSAEADTEDVRVAAVDYRTFGYQYPHGDAQQLAEFIARARTDVGALLDEIDRLNQKIKSFEEFGSAEALRAEVAVEAGVRDAAWRAYLAEDDVSAAVNAAIRTAVALATRRFEAVRERVRTRHARRPDGYCVMCRWPDGSLMRWPCPDYVDSQVPATTAEGSAEGGTSKGSEVTP